MLNLERVWEERNRIPVLLGSGALNAVVAVVDWWTKAYVSLGFLYLFPIMYVSAFVPRWVVVVLAVGCAILAEVFSSLTPSFVRLCFEALALAGCGLFLAELIRNRRLTQRTEARLRALVETSPAAIVTVDERGFIELANQAAGELMAPRDGSLVGTPIAAFLPELHHALRWEEAPQFRASMQCQAHRGNGESFTAFVWFSTYKEGAAHRLAAIIADATEERGDGVAIVPLPKTMDEWHLAIGRWRWFGCWFKGWPIRKSRQGWKSPKAPSRTRCNNFSPKQTFGRAPSCVRVALEQSSRNCIGKRRPSWINRID